MDVDTASRAELIKRIEELLRRQQASQKRVEELEAENEPLRQQVGAKAVPAFVKANRAKPEPKPRKKRERGYARVKAEVTRRLHQADEACPECGERHGRRTGRVATTGDRVAGHQGRACRARGSGARV